MSGCFTSSLSISNCDAPVATMMVASPFCSSASRIHCAPWLAARWPISCLVSLVMIFMQRIVQRRLSLKRRLRLKPSTNDRKNMRRLFRAERMSFRNVMPLLQTPAAAGRRRVLRHKDRMIPPRRLLAVVGDLRRRQSFADQIRRVPHDRVETLFAQDLKLATAQLEFGAKTRARKCREEIVRIHHLQ